MTPLNSAPRWTLLALFVLAASGLDYSRGQVDAMYYSLMASFLAAVLERLWMWSLNEKPSPEFRSVWHVNHSSLYSLIPLGARIGVLFMCGWWLKALGIAAVVPSLAFLAP